MTKVADESTRVGAAAMYHSKDLVALIVQFHRVLDHVMLGDHSGIQAVLDESNRVGRLLDETAEEMKSVDWTNET